MDNPGMSNTLKAIKYSSYVISRNLKAQTSQI